MTSKRFLAIDLNDFHSSTKKWQGRPGTEDFVKVRVIGARNLNKAKEYAADGNDNAWYVVGLGTTRSMVYAATPGSRRA